MLLTGLFLLFCGVVVIYNARLPMRFAGLGWRVPAWYRVAIGLLGLLGGLLMLKAGIWPH